MPSEPIDRSARKAPAEPLLPKAWNAPQEFHDRLGEGPGRQRLMQAEDALLLVLHAPPGPEQATRDGRLFLRNSEGRWKPAPLSHGKHPIGELLTEYEEATNQIDQNIESAGTAEDYFAALTALTPLVRSAHNLYSVLQEARTACKEDRQLILLRDRAYAINRRLELLQQDAKNMLDFVIARRAEEQAESARRQAKAAHRLNILAAFFLPLATLAGVFGMDVRHGLEGFDSTKHLLPIPLLGLVGAGLLAGVLLTVFVTRK